MLFVVGSRRFELVELVLKVASLFLKSGAFLLELREAGFGFVDTMGDGLRREERDPKGREERERREVRRARKSRRDERRRDNETYLDLLQSLFLLSTVIHRQPSRFSIDLLLVALDLDLVDLDFLLHVVRLGLDTR